MNPGRRSIALLLADMQSAHTFLDAAARWTGAEAIGRNVAQARSILASVKHHLPQLDGDAELLRKVEAARDKLSQRLDEFAGRC